MGKCFNRTKKIQDYVFCPPAGNEEGLVGYWNFEEEQGDMAIDLSGNDNHGSLNGPTYITDIPNLSCQLTTVNGCDSVAFFKSYYQRFKLWD